ncbi:Co2+/Mg2+ efflux protein ApaG [Vreelandella massiliensis]|uniref:Co2+/Mg2+ efflux protein ApaG n=1 Tax=Vreelandella massiliensis TaxID=1816686 RepID=UPI00096A72BC|nr:Co2+/Mg2+ efflux protein ApaG [Halomonas massiliensis]MYL23229.1 Co2+/Mg2+ efflux protein ApaG [Halomonas alkaliantarctica]
MNELPIHVAIAVHYNADESSVADARHVFSYRVTVENKSPHSVQLLARYWKITQGSGACQEVRGKGVVGQQPLIGPGQRFRYTSRAILQTPVGTMEGAYTLLDTSTQRAFDVAVAPFSLAAPLAIH